MCRVSKKISERCFYNSNMQYRMPETLIQNEWPEVNIWPVFLNIYGAQESIPRNEFHQPMKHGGPVR
jgi:hypothetical protein